MNRTTPILTAALTLTASLAFAAAPARAQTPPQSAPPAQTPPADAAPTPEETTAGRALLDGAIRAHGGDAFLKVKSLKVVGKGELTAPESQGGFKLPLDSVTLLTAAPDRSRLDADSPFGRLTFGAPGGGKKAWYRFGEAGAPADLPGAETPFADPTAILRAAAAPGSTRRVRAVPVDPQVAVPDAKGLKAFEVRDASGAASEVYVDADTSLVRRVRTKAGKNDLVTVLGGYKAVAGVHLPTTLLVRQNGADLLSLTLTSVEVDVAVEDALFAKPAVAAEAPATPAAPPQGGA